MRAHFLCFWIWLPNPSKYVVSTNGTMAMDNRMCVMSTKRYTARIQPSLQNGVLGVVFWDVTNPAAPEAIHYMRLPDVFYPDSYARVVLSTFWQYPWLYVAAADNGVFVVDASNPYEPALVGEYRFDPVLRAGGVWALGNYLVVGSAEQTKTAILDITVPYEPQAVPGGMARSSELKMATLPNGVTVSMSPWMTAVPTTVMLSGSVMSKTRPISDSPTKTNPSS